MIDKYRRMTTYFFSGEGVADFDCVLQNRIKGWWILLKYSSSEFIKLICKLRSTNF